MRHPWFALALMLASCGGSCRPTEEERLLRQIDALETHLYLGAKVALATREPTPEIVSARQVLTTSTATLTATDVAKAAYALMQLRGLGQRELELGKNSTLPPFIPALLGAGDAEVMDAQLDHFLLLLAATGLKFHPKSPVPIPSVLLLYEAYMTDPRQLTQPVLGAWAHSTKAFVLATHEYCSLAKVETDRVTLLEAISLDPALLMGLGRFAAHVPEGGALIAAIVVLPFVTRILAHGTTAMCFYGRGDQAEGDVELGRFIDLAEQIGVPPEDTALVRAYLSYRGGDVAKTRAHLEQAKQSQLVDERGRREIDELLAHFEGDRGALAEYFDKAFFAAFFAKIAWSRLEPVARDALAESDLLAPMRELMERLEVERSRAESAWRDVSGCGG